MFLQYAELIALDFSFTFRTNDDLEVLFYSLPTQLESYRIKHGAVKTSRWFSWHNGCESQYHEFWSTRMLLSFAHPHEADPDENNKSFKEMRSGGDSLGGLRLALQCCSWKTWYAITAIKLADQPLWTYYSDSVKKIKDAAQGFQRTLLWSGDGWMNTEQFNQLAGVFVQEATFEKVRAYAALSVRFLGQESADQHLAGFLSCLWTYILQIMNYRARTLSKHASGPEAYAPAIGDDPALAQEAVDFMLADWRALRLLKASPGQAPQELAADMRDSISKPLRLAFQLMECGRTEESLSVLKSLLYRLPDTKVVEDVHQRLRVEAMANPNNRLLPRELQGLVQTSGQLEARQIPHPARLDKESFLQRWKVTPSDFNFKVSLDSGVVKLPKYFSKIIDKKTWRTMNEEALSFSSAAWAWIREYISKDFKGKGIKLRDSHSVSIRQSFGSLFCFFFIDDSYDR